MYHIYPQTKEPLDNRMHHYFIYTLERRHTPTKSFRICIFHIIKNCLDLSRCRFYKISIFYRYKNIIATNTLRIPTTVLASPHKYCICSISNAESSTELLGLRPPSPGRERALKKSKANKGCKSEKKQGENAFFHISQGINYHYISVFCLKRGSSARDNWEIEMKVLLCFVLTLPNHILLI